MGIDFSQEGLKLGPYRYTAGIEWMKSFARAIGDDDPLYLDDAAGRESEHGACIAPPTFCVNFNMQPFKDSVFGDVLGVDYAKLLHGEQTFEFHRPVKDGDRLVTEGVVERMWEKGALDFYTIRADTKLDTGEPVVTGWYTAVVRK